MQYLLGEMFQLIKVLAQRLDRQLCDRHPRKEHQREGDSNQVRQGYSLLQSVKKRDDQGCRYNKKEKDRDLNVTEQDGTLCHGHFGSLPMKVPALDD